MRETEFKPITFCMTTSCLVYIGKLHLHEIDLYTDYIPIHTSPNIIKINKVVYR